MLGLVLQGGGARGAFQAGVIQALIENGYNFDGVAGTSIGALNGAMLVQGDFGKCLELWRGMEVSHVIDFDDTQAKKLAERKIDAGTIKYLAASFGRAIAGKGFSGKKVKTLIDTYIDEARLRRSSLDFGLVTYNLTERKPKELFKEDIPEGYFAEYIMASANFPVMQKLKIDSETYVDGGVYDNLPIDMMIKRGYDDIIAVTTKKTTVKLKDKNVSVRFINPSEKPSTMFNFTGDNVRRQLTMGYLDGIKEIKGLKGKLFYIDRLDYDVLENELLSLPEEFFEELTSALSLPLCTSRILNTCRISEAIAKLVGLKKYTSLGEVFVALAEKVALAAKMNRLQTVMFSAFLYDIKREMSNIDKTDKVCEVFDIFVKYYK